MAEVIPHPDYRRVPPGMPLNDVMLLKLTRPAQFNDFVSPVCLPSPSLAQYGEPGAPVFGNNNVTVVGWGMTGTGVSNKLKTASTDVQQKLVVPAVANKKCIKRWKDDRNQNLSGKLE